MQRPSVQLMRAATEKFKRIWSDAPPYRNKRPTNVYEELLTDDCIATSQIEVARVTEKK